MNFFWLALEMVNAPSALAKAFIGTILTKTDVATISTPLNKLANTCIAITT